jgi:hypothetical protein
MYQMQSSNFLKRDAGWGFGKACSVQESGYIQNIIKPNNKPA